MRTPKHIIQAYDDNSDHYHAGKYWSLIREEVYTVLVRTLSRYLEQHMMMMMIEVIMTMMVTTGLNQ